MILDKCTLGRDKSCGSSRLSVGASNDLTGDAAHAWTPTNGSLFEFLTVGFATLDHATGLVIHQSGDAGLIRGIELIGNNKGDADRFSVDGGRLRC